VFTTPHRCRTLLVIGIAVSVLASCDAWTRASGYVIDATGHAVPGATVLLQRDADVADTARTDSEGRFQLGSGAHGGNRATAAIRACTTGMQSEVVMVDASGGVSISGIILLLKPRPMQRHPSPLLTVKPLCP